MQQTTDPRLVLATQILALISSTQTKPDGEPRAHPFLGKYVICRCQSAGVHAGVLVAQHGDEAVLKDSRRLWSWTANAGVALSGLSQHGLKTGKIDTIVPEIALTGVIETIPCTESARASIHSA